MARTSKIDITDVEMAVEQLRQEKKDITAYQVRQILGCGSYDKIGEYLKILEKEQVHQDPDKNLTHYLCRLIQPVAEQLIQDAKEPFETEREEMQAVIKSLTKDLREAKSGINYRNIALGDLQKRLDNQIETSNEKIQTLHDSERFLQLENERLTTEVKVLTEQAREDKQHNKERIKQHAMEIKAVHKANQQQMKSVMDTQKEKDQQLITQTRDIEKLNLAMKQAVKDNGALNKKLDEIPKLKKSVSDLKKTHRLNEKKLEDEIRQLKKHSKKPITRS